MMTHPSIPELTSNGRRLLMTKQWPDNFKLQSVCSSRFAQEQMWCHSTFSHPCFTGEAKCIWLLCVCVCVFQAQIHTFIWPSWFFFCDWLAAQQVSTNQSDRLSQGGRCKTGPESQIMPWLAVCNSLLKNVISSSVFWICGLIIV